MARAFATPPGPAGDPGRPGPYDLWAWFAWAPLMLAATVIFGTAALLLALLSHRAAFWCGVAWARVLCAANFTRVRVEGRDRVPRGQACVILCNHASLFDVPAFYGAWNRQFRWVMKEELRRIPFLGWGTAALRNVFVDRGDHARALESLRRARPLLDSGVSLVVFPEGTRSADGRLGPFKKGGFRVALDAGLPILPVSIAGTRAILPGRSLRLRPGRVRITVHPPVPTAGLGPGDLDGLVARVREAIASALPGEPAAGGDAAGRGEVPSSRRTP